jgi:hypothetical protein
MKHLLKLVLVFCLICALLATVDAFKRGEKGKYKRKSEERAATKPKQELKVEVLV